MREDLGHRAGGGHTRPESTLRALHIPRLLVPTFHLEHSEELLERGRFAAKPLPLVSAVVYVLVVVVVCAFAQLLRVHLHQHLHAEISPRLSVPH